MSDDLPDELPPHVLEFMPVTQDEWRSMSNEEREEVMEQTLEAFMAAMQPLVEFVHNELVPWANETAQAISEPLIDVANQIDHAGINHAELSPQESAELTVFVKQAKQLDRGKQ